MESHLISLVSSKNQHLWLLNTKHKSLIGSTTAALQKKQVYCAHKHVINGAHLCSEVLHTLLSRQFWPGNISPGHSGPILNVFWSPEDLKEFSGYLLLWYLLLLQDRERSLSLFLAGRATCHAPGPALAKPGSARARRRLRSKAAGCCWLAPAHGFGWHLPLMCSIPGWEGGVGLELKTPVGVRKISNSWACPNRWDRAELGEGERGNASPASSSSASPLPTEPARSLCSVSYILLRCQQQFWSDINTDLDIKDQILWPWDLYQPFQIEPH